MSRNKKNNVYPCKPQFYYIKVGFKGVKIIYRYVFVMYLVILIQAVGKYRAVIYPLLLKMQWMKIVSAITNMYLNVT